MEQYICFDIGGTSIKHGVADQEGNFIAKGSVPTEAQATGGPGILAKVKQITAAYLERYMVCGVAISTAGMVNPITGQIVYAAEHLIPRYMGMCLKAEIEREFSLPCEVENDVNCAGLGELWRGSGRGAQSIFCLTVGTGIGGCVIFDGSVWHGTGNSAGEIGYMYTSGGLLQDVAATSVLVKRVAEQKGLDEASVDGKQVFAWAKGGDPLVLREINMLLRYLSEGIANVCYTINPEVVILGGGIMEQSEFIEPLLREVMQETLLDKVRLQTRISFATCGNDAGLLGALYNFRQRYVS